MIARRSIWKPVSDHRTRVPTLKTREFVDRIWLRALEVKLAAGNKQISRVMNTPSVSLSLLPRSAKRSFNCPSLCRCLFCRLKNLPADDLALPNAINSYLILCSRMNRIFEISRRVDQRDRRSRWMNDRDTKKCSLRQDKSGIRWGSYTGSRFQNEIIKLEERGSHSSALSSTSRFRPANLSSRTTFTRSFLLALLLARLISWRCHPVMTNNDVARSRHVNGTKQ